MYYSGAPLSQVLYFLRFSKILKSLWSAVLYFVEQILNKKKSGTDKLSTCSCVDLIFVLNSTLFIL